VAYRPRRLLVAAIPLLLVATACGGDDPKPRAGASLSGTPSVTATPTASGTAAGSATASSSSRPGSSGGPSSSATASSGGGGTSGTPKPGASTSPPARPLFLSLRLAKRCVVPGQEQMAAIRSVPGAEFIVDTVYSDRKEGSVHGGLHRDKVNSEGKYDYTWRVLPGTPPGEAVTVVRALKDGKRGSATAKFRVSAIC
jgi:hypothetical protein